MPRPLLHRNQTEQTQESRLSLTAAPRETQRETQENAVQLARRLKEPRSKAYIDAIHKLDAGGATMSAAERDAIVDAIVDAIRAEFPDIVSIASIPIGIVAQCFLGAPYEVHTINITGGIIAHYKRGEPLPEGMEGARSLAAHGGYEFVEVYSDGTYRAISSDGAVSVVHPR